MERITHFGSNPRHLKMYVYVPENLPDAPAVVVTLHGCSQSAKRCAKLTGWNKLADKNGFIVVYPGQRWWNNMGRCFNWFTRNNQTRDKGEALSVRSMVDHVVKNYHADTNKIFITGLSAGGAMTSNMLAMYPEVFQAGAVFSGGAYKAARNMFTSWLAQQGWLLQSGVKLGNHVRAAVPGYSGEYPGVAVFHGKRDRIVNRRNAMEIVKQWTNVHDTDERADSVINRFNGNKRVTLSLYRDKKGKEVVKYFSIKRMGHAVATDPGKCPCEGGGRGMFAHNNGFYSTYFAADFFGLIRKSCKDETTSEKCK